MKKTLIMTLTLLLAVTLITASAWTYWDIIQTGWTGANDYFNGRGILNNNCEYDMCYIIVYWEKNAGVSGDNYHLSRKMELQAASSSVIEWWASGTPPTYADYNLNLQTWAPSSWGIGYIIAKICAPYTYAYGSAEEIDIEVGNRAQIQGITMWEIGLPEGATNRRPIWYSAAPFVEDVNYSLSTIAYATLYQMIANGVIPASVIWDL